MRKIMAVLLAGIFISNIALAETGLTDDEYKNLEQLRKKLTRMKREMDTFMKDIVSTYPAVTGNTAPLFEEEIKVDVSENNDSFIVKADLPGIEKDKIEITLENGRLLRIAAMREILKSQTAPGVVKQERSMGRFERALELPGEGMSQGIKASYKDGVLEIAIPKKMPGKEEKVKITVL